MVLDGHKITNNFKIIFGKSAVFIRPTNYNFMLYHSPIFHLVQFAINLNLALSCQLVITRLKHKIDVYKRL